MLAERTARAAGELLLERFRQPAQGVERKTTSTDMVSDADRDAERLIEELLLSERPEDGLLAEEGGRSEARSGRRWVVDPIDGTTNYLYGLAGWAVSIALEEGGATVLGVVHQPATGDTFTAMRGEGALLGGERIAVSGQEDVSDALVSTGFGYDPERRAWQAELLRSVLPRIRDVRRAGAASLDLCEVAAGRTDAYWERGLQHWDWAAGRLVVSEAGGTVIELEDEPFGLLAAGPAIADELLALVAWTPGS